MTSKHSIRQLLLLVLCLIVLITAGYGCRKKKRAGLGPDDSSGGTGTVFVLSPPSALTANEISPYQIYLSWADNSNNEDGFEIERAINDPLYYTLLTTVTVGTNSYFDNAVSPLNTYYYRVRAFNTVPDYSTYSNPVSVFTSVGIWTKISAGEAYSLALTNNGTLWSWGNNEYGQLGLGSYESFILTPTQIGSDTDWSSMSAGSYHALAIKAGTRAGTLWAWGSNDSGQLGVGDPGEIAYSDTPAQVGSDSDWSIISGGGLHTLGLKKDNTLWSWGNNLYGQLGQGDTGYIDTAGEGFGVPMRVTPTQIGTYTDWVVISAGYYHNLVLTKDKVMWAWGFNYFGQLGLRDTDDRMRPNQIGGTPSPHPGLTATLFSLTQVDLNWSDTDNEDGFKILRAVTPTISTYNLLDTISSGITSYSDTTAISNTTYSYRVEAFNNVGENLSMPVLLVITDTYVPKFASVNSFPTTVSASDWTVVNTKFSQAFACKTDFTLWAWGNWPYGYFPQKIGTDTDWVDVTAGGDSFSIARKTNGTIWSWGTNYYGQLGLGDSVDRLTPTQIGNDSDWSVIVAGTNHCLGLKNMNTLWAWGACGWAPNQGQLGMGDTIGRNIPSPLGIPITPSDLIITAISLSQLDLSWTDNSDNETGFKIERKDGITGSYVQIGTVDRDITSYSDTGLNPGNTYYYHVMAYNIFGNSPYSAASSNFSAVAPSSLRATMALPDRINLSWTDKSPDESGFRIERKINLTGTYEEIATVGTDVNTWFDTISISNGIYYFYQVRAYNNFGNTPYSNQIWVTESGNWLTISTTCCSSLHNIATKTDGSIWAWGYNAFGQLGIGDTNDRNTPSQIAGDLGQTAEGYLHTISKKANGSIWAWGYNACGELGLGDSGASTYRLTPTRIGLDTDWSILDAGFYYSVGLKTTGELWAWGYNTHGQLGLGDTISRNTPSRAGTAQDWVTVTAGGGNFIMSVYCHTIGKKDDGTIWVWGANNYGQLGLGDVINRNTPTLLGLDTDWLMVVAGGMYTTAKKADNTLWSWGWNYSGQLGLGDAGQDTYRRTPTQIGTDSDWDTFTTGVCDMAAFGHTIARKTNGTLWSWGSNINGQLGLGDTSINLVTTPMQIGNDSDWSTLNAGYGYTLALKTNGTLWSWGCNNKGQLGFGDAVNRNIPILIIE